MNDYQGLQAHAAYPLLFSPFCVGEYRLKNRVIALPVHTGFACTAGDPSPWMKELYTRLSDSGAAMVVVANAAVSADGVVSAFNLRADRDEYIKGLSGLASAIKDKGAVACLQLNHAGRLARTSVPLLPSAMGGSNLPFNVESLKDFMEFFPFEKRFTLTRYFLQQVKTWRRAMTESERERVIEDFAAAALRACKSGFDMVELHGANGYLLCQFLSPFTNRLADGFGGDFHSRTRFVRAVIRAVKSVLPEGFPVGFRLLLQEWVPGGIEPPEARGLAQCLQEEGIAYISVSAGTFSSIFSPAVQKEMAKEAYLARETAKLKNTVHPPVIISGRITTPETAERILDNALADLIGLGRPLRADPDWVKKAEKGEGRIRTCINCNQCLKQVILEKGFSCSLWSRVRQEKAELAHLLLTRNDNTLWLVANERDINAFQNNRILLFPDQNGPSAPAVLFVEEKDTPSVSEPARKRFLEWITDDCGIAKPVQQILTLSAKESGTALESSIHDEISRQGFGRMIMAGDPDARWRERLLYTERGKVIAHLGSGRGAGMVLVPVDLSGATPLVLVFLKNTFMKHKGVTLDFIHVLIGKNRADQAVKQWERLKAVAGIGDKVDLSLLRARTDAASAIVRQVRTGGYGTVVMGKRGMSGLKRRIPGSVSARVQTRLTDRTIYLVD
mgnify:CR=1 FL=1